MVNIKRKLLLLATMLLILVLFLPLSPASAELSYPLTLTDAQVSNALDYLRSQQSTDGSIGGFANSAWVTIAIAAASEDPHNWKVGSNPSIVDYLASSAANATLITDYARMILAITAADENPSSFGGINFVSLLKASYQSGQIGDASLLNDDFWGIMALISAGESPASEIAASSVAFIKSHQNSDGGWSWGVGGGSDVDDTASAVMALIAAGESPSSTNITAALAYIKSTQMSNGGFESWGTTNADTDSWAIGSIVAAGQNPAGNNWMNSANKTAVDDLLSFQQGNGSFFWQTGTPGMSANRTTASAIQALLGKPYPVKIVQQSVPSVPIYVRVEGKTTTIWSGNVTVTTSDIRADNSGTIYHLSQPTALGALDKASNNETRFSYYVTDQYGSPYVRSVAGEEPEGLKGWLYRVDYISPSVGAGDFILSGTNKEVLWYFHDWTALPLKLSLDKTGVWVGENMTVTVTQYNDATSSWEPSANATVHAGVDYVTDSDGRVVISIANEGIFNIFAEKTNSVRSDKVGVTVTLLYGDATGNGVVDSTDITKVERIIAGLDTLTPGADANRDGIMNALDITKVERIMAGLN